MDALVARSRVTVSVGLLQVNTENAGLFHLRPEQLFDHAPISRRQRASRPSLRGPNADCTKRSRRTPVCAVRYNSGTYNLGFQNGYLAEVLKNAKP